MIPECYLHLFDVMSRYTAVVLVIININNQLYVRSILDMFHRLYSAKAAHKWTTLAIKMDDNTPSKHRLTFVDGGTTTTSNSSNFTLSAGLF